MVQPLVDGCFAGSGGPERTPCCERDVAVINGQDDNPDWSIVLRVVNVGCREAESRDDRYLVIR